MACQTIYAEMMSSHLDGQLDDDAESRLHAHVGACGLCAPFWDAMQEADALFVASAHAPIPVPVEFSVKVMARIAAVPAVQPQLGTATPEIAYHIPHMVPMLPSLAHASGVYGSLLPVQTPDFAQQWQQRISGYVRGLAAAGLTVTLTAGLLLVLMVSGVWQVGGPFAPVVEGVRTFISAAYRWASTLVTGVGSEAAVGGVFLLGLLVAGGWQIVSGYQRAASRHWDEAAVVRSVA